MVLPFRVKKAMSSPEPATAATSKAIMTMYRVLRCLAGCAMMLAGVFVPGLVNETPPGLLPVGVETAILCVFAVVFLLLARVALAHLERLAKREGRLTQRWQ